MSEYPDYFEYDDGEDDTYFVERDPYTGAVVVEASTRYIRDSKLVGVYRFDNGLLVEAVGRSVMPEALADMIEERWGKCGKQ